MKIGQFSRTCQTSPRMIRFYESLNLVAPQRDGNGYRTYTEQDAALVKKIVLLSQAGVPLKDLALMRDCLYDEPQDFCDALRGRLNERMGAIDAQIEGLAESKRLLEELLAR